jgi:hypothetical protein
VRVIGGWDWVKGHLLLGRPRKGTGSSTTSVGLQQRLTANDARDQRRYLGPVLNGAVSFFQVVVTDDAQELRHQGLAGDVAATQKALISGASSRVRLSMMSWVGMVKRVPSNYGDDRGT